MNLVSLCCGLKFGFGVLSRAHSKQARHRSRVHRSPPSLSHPSAPAVPPFTRAPSCPALSAAVPMPSSRFSAPSFDRRSNPLEFRSGGESTPRRRYNLRLETAAAGSTAREDQHSAHRFSSRNSMLSWHAATARLSLSQVVLEQSTVADQCARVEVSLVPMPGLTVVPFFALVQCPPPPLSRPLFPRGHAGAPSPVSSSQTPHAPVRVVSSLPGHFRPSLPCPHSVDPSYPPFPA